MERTDIRHWIDNTRLQVAILVGPYGRRELVRANDKYVPQTDAKAGVRQLFACAGLPRVYDPEADKGQLECAGLDCSARLHFRKAAGRRGDKEKNKASFQSYHVDDHKAGCVFKNPKREKEERLSLDEAIAQSKPILVNINDLPCGFYTMAPMMSTAKIGEYVSEIEHWKDSTFGAEGYHEVSVHSLGDVMALKEKIERKGGHSALELMWFNNNTIPVNFEKFWNGSMSGLLIQMINRAEELHRIGRTTVQLGTRMVEFDIAQGSRAKTFDVQGRRIHGRSVDLHRNGRAVIEQNLYFNGLEEHGVQQARDIMEQLVKDIGGRLYVMAAPTLKLPSNAHERGLFITRLKNMVSNQSLSAANPAKITLDWTLDRDFEKQLAPRAIERAIPNPDFFSALPFNNDAPEMAEGITRPRAAAAEQRPEVIKSAPLKPKQLKLL